MAAVQGRHATSLSWGDWRMGDLADAARRASDVFGPGAPVSSMIILPPAAPENLPSVQVVVEDRVALERLRAELSHSECLYHLQGSLDGSAFQTEANDLFLHVWVRGGGE